MDQEELESYMKAGKIASQALEYGASLIKEGALLLEVTEAIEGKILALGGGFAFPPQISLNDIAAHYCCGHEERSAFKHGDIAKLDIGVQINGFVADTAKTIVLSDDPRLRLLAEASRQALNSALKIVRPGVKLSDIGKEIEREIKGRGFNPIINLSGHGLGKYIIHDSPSIPNFNAPMSETLKEGQAIAIEPFASTGAGMIYESSNATIFAVDKVRPVRSPMTREVLKTIEGYKGLPFAQRWLVKKHGLKAMFALNELRTLGILKEYPPLPDKSHGLVSQAEHTILVLDKPIIITSIDSP
jgi:methionyl aminopeptidase